MARSESTVLYRKYRPKSFAEVVGQEHIVTVLQNALRLDKVAHAYLFSGTRGTGKTTLARLLAKAYNCENRGDDAEPCNKCQTCQEFSGGHALDLIEIDAASNRGIDDIRELRDAVRFSPMRARRKVYIVDEVHMLSKDAWNAFLKTLEEPPEHAMFIMATTELHKVPETILSRTQNFEFRRLSQEKIRERIRILLKSEKYKLDDDGLTLLSFLADGSLRDAENMLGQLISAFPEGAGKDALENVFGLPKLQSVHGLLESALKKEPARVLELCERIFADGIDPKVLGRLLVHEARMLLLCAVSPQGLTKFKKELSEDHAAFFERHKNMGQKNIEDLLVKLLDAYHSQYRGAFQELPLELALLDAATEPTSAAFKKPDFLVQ